MDELCSPALIYLFFSILQILIDIYLGLYNTAMIKLIVTIMITLLLNVLCEKNLGIISWIFVLLPLIFISTIVSTLLYVFGMSISIGTTKQKSYEPSDNMVKPEELIIERPYPKHGLSKYIHIPFFKNADTVSDVCKQCSNLSPSPSSFPGSSSSGSSFPGSSSSGSSSSGSPSSSPGSSSGSSPSPSSTGSTPTPKPFVSSTTSYNSPIPYGSSSPEYESFVSY